MYIHAYNIVTSFTAGCNLDIKSIAHVLFCYVCANVKSFLVHKQQHYSSRYDWQ